VHSEDPSFGWGYWALFMGTVGSGLVVTPASDFVSSGSVGGPFTPSSQTYGLSNSSSASITWSLSLNANWLTVSSGALSGTLAPGATTTVTLLINNTANSLTADTYLDTVSFFNTTSGVGNTTRPVTLTIANMPPGPALAITPTNGFDALGPVGGPFMPD